MVEMPGSIDPIENPGYSSTKCSRLVGKLMYLNTISIYVNVKKNLKRTKKIFLQCKYIGGQKTNDIRVTFIDITVFDEDVSSHFV